MSGKIFLICRSEPASNCKFHLPVTEPMTTRTTGVYRYREVAYARIGIAPEEEEGTNPAIRWLSINKNKYKNFLTKIL